MSPLSTFLFARPSFVEGVSRIVDVAGTLNEYNRSESGEMADYLALFADWRLIGMDIQRAMLEARSGTVEGSRLVKQTR
jgi:hypothetical protein